MNIGSDETLDDLLHGELKLVQRKKGFRYSVDALLLAHFALPLAGGADVLDMGAGAGTLALIIAKRGAPRSVTALEVLPELAELARRNARLNRTEPTVEVVQADAMDPGTALPERGFDLIVTNPPFRTAASGRQSPNRERAAARHEIMMNLPGWIESARRLIRPPGAVCIVYPEDQIERLLGEARGRGMHPRRALHATDRPGGERKLCVLELVSRETGCEELPDAAIQTEQGKFSLDGYR